MAYFELLIVGAFGALLKDIIQDGKIVLPKKLNGEFSLGFLGGILIGAAAGILVDGSLVTAFFAGYAGTSAIQNLILKNTARVQGAEESVEQTIRRVSLEEGVDFELAVRVAKCESNLNPSAVHENAPNSIDRGLFQINSKFHPEVNQAQAYDTEFSARFFCKAFKSGNLGWWDATRKCWEKNS